MTALSPSDNSGKPIGLGLLGLGTVGGGVISVLARNGAEIARRAGRDIRAVAAAVRDPARPRPCALPEGFRLSADPLAVVRAADVQVVIELMGGLEPARTLILEAIAQGKHVITANKAVIATHGHEIFAAAQAKGVMVAFEAAVGGGIPIIKAIREGLAANRIEQVAGIVNGTTNYILTAMSEEGRDFADVLAEAQRLGYAEADPSFDIDGIDAGHKTAILAAIAFGMPLKFDQVYLEGISQISVDDIEYARTFGYRVKHLAIARRGSHGVELRVHPTLIPERRLIANVNGVKNAVLVLGDAVGATLFYGAGAGAEPTASAVVADVVDVVRMLTADPDHRVPHLAFQPDALTDLPVLPMAEVETAYYLRLTVEDRPGVLADVARMLADQGISIEAILQKEPLVPVDPTPDAPVNVRLPIVLITQRCLEARMDEALAAMSRHPSILGKPLRIRLESLSG